MNWRSAARKPGGLALLVRPERIEAALWRRYGASKSAESRQDLFDHHRPFAERLAKALYTRRPPGNFDVSDVRQLAYEGLLHAIERYDHARGIPFEAYARRRIQGHVHNGLAQTSEAAAHYSHRHRIERERLRSLQHGDEAEQADALAALARLSAELAIGMLLESEAGSDIESIADPAPSAYDSLAWNELVARVHQTLEGLPEREAYVMQQHYRNGVSFQQIALVLGVTKGRVSQIHRAALQRLRSQLAKLV